MLKVELREPAEDQLARERQAAIGRLAMATRAEEELVERFKAAGLLAATTDEVNRVAELRRGAEALSEEWWCFPAGLADPEGEPF